MEKTNDAGASQYIASAIVSTYNSEEFIRGRIDDLLHQSLGANLEIIVINSGSQQNEDAIIRKEYLHRFKNIKYLRTEQRETIYSAWNRGIQMSSSPYITNANTDDRLHPNAIEILVKTLEKHHECAIAYADQYVVTEKNLTFSSIKQGKRLQWPVYHPLTLFSRHLTGPQALWRSSLHFKEGIWFDEQYEIAGDYDFVCKVGLKFKMVRVDKVLGLYYLSKQQTNKEYQEPHRTEKETYSVKERYAKQYLSGLNNSEFEELYRKAKNRVRIPRIVFTVVHRWLELVAPQYQILSKMFWYWMLSLMEEFKGDLDQAVVYADHYRSSPSGGMMRMRYERLQAI